MCAIHTCVVLVKDTIQQSLLSLLTPPLTIMTSTRAI